MIKISRVDVTIAGDLIHSYLYSGTLFLIGSDSVIKTYDWKNMIRDLLKSQVADASVRSFAENILLDVRKAGEYREIFNHQAETLNLEVEEQFLNRYMTGSLSLLGWPADIGIYSNRFYVADERGASSIAFKFEEKKLDETEKLIIISDRAYSISTNSAQRVAIATGPNGVFSAALNNQFNKFRDVRKILEIESYDCEWNNQFLIANTSSGPFAAVFERLPNPPGKKAAPDTWHEWNNARREAPLQKGKIGDGSKEIIYSWLGGTKVFNIFENGQLEIKKFEEQSTLRTALLLKNETQFESQLETKLDKLLTVRSALFGSVIQTERNLYILSNDGLVDLKLNPVAWRVFPRSKNYVNQLHIVLNDYVQVKAYCPTQENMQSDVFGVDEILD